MRQIVEAIYADGVLKPLAALPFHEKQRLRLTIAAVDEQATSDHGAHLHELIDRLRRSTFSYGGPLPTREELHERARNV
jgi:predicted DNA-binding antitoxin AbrB/MazE fold protein